MSKSASIVVWKEDPTGKRDSLFYSIDGEIVRSRNRRGDYVEFQYDAIHRLVKKWGSETTTDTITYGSNWTKAQNENVTYYTYNNSGGQVTHVRTLLGGKTYDVYYGYNSAEQLDSIGGSGSQVTFKSRRYTYSGPRLRTIRLNGRTAESTFDNMLRVSSRMFEGGDTTSLGRLSWDPVADRESSKSSLDFLNHKLEYDIAGVIRSQFTDLIPAEAGDLFDYDGRGRLVADTFAIVESYLCTFDEDNGWECPDPTPYGGDTYVWDAVSNLDSMKVDGTWLNALYDSTATGMRLKSFAGCDYDTDFDGNVTERDCPTEDVRFHWDSENRLKAMKIVGGDSVDYYYDPVGRLVRKAVNGSTESYYIWSGAHLFAELDSNGSVLVEYSYYPGMDRPHAIAVGDTVYFAHADGFGDVIGLVSQTSGKNARYDYDRWGHSGLSDVWENLHTDAPNRARFKGALWMGDEDIELYYMRNRWYEPKTGRFLSEDPIGLAGGMNLYTFAGGDPVNRRDPMGLQECFTYHCPLDQWTMVGVATDRIMALIDASNVGAASWWDTVIGSGGTPANGNGQKKGGGPNGFTIHRERMKVVREFYKPLTCELGVIAEGGLRLAGDVVLLKLYATGLAPAVEGGWLVVRGTALSTGLVHATSLAGPWWAAAYVGPSGGALQVIGGTGIVLGGAMTLEAALGLPIHGGFSLAPVNFINFAFSRPFGRC